ncbi:MAG: hypothetical protein AVDCRST_MAG25-3649, partial [uncultured Rubrobacteraceae bacterium]
RWNTTRSGGRSRCTRRASSFTRSSRTGPGARTPSSTWGTRRERRARMGARSRCTRRPWRCTGSSATSAGPPEPWNASPPARRLVATGS